MKSLWSRKNLWSAVAMTLALLGSLSAGLAQAPADPRPAALLLSPEQLDNMVAPVALYPDPLLSLVLSASTYPLELVAAQQWLGRNGNLQGAQLIDAAKQQNWDPSVQALVAFPDALSLLANDIRWTVDLGNAFLAQQADVMSAVQRMRARARASGKLATTPQQVVTVDTQAGREAIVIQPANPQVIYVPIYRPSYVWGPPVWGAYPYGWYPSGFSVGFGFGPGYYMGAYYPSWGGWGGWGWNCGWFGGGLYINVGFFNRHGYRGGGYGYYGGSGYYGGYGMGVGYTGRAAWVHNPGHRMGIPYPNQTVAGRYGGGRVNGGQRGGGGQWNGGRYDSSRAGYSQFNRASVPAASGGDRSPNSGGWQRFSDTNRPSSVARSDAGAFARPSDSGYRAGNRIDSGSYRQPAPNYAANSNPRIHQSPPQGERRGGSGQDYRSAPSMGGSSSPRYSSPRSSGFSAPRSFSSPSQSFSAPRSSSGPRPSGGGAGFSGARSGGNSGVSGGRSGGGGGGGGHRR